MDLNKAMVEMYKRRSASGRNKTLPGKKTKIDPDLLRAPESPSKEEPDMKRHPNFAEVLNAMDYKPKISFDQLYGCDAAKSKILNCVKLFIRSTDKLAQKSDWPICICGSRGLGKTSIIEAAAMEAKLRLIPISLKNLVDLSRPEFKMILNQLVNYCLSNQPAIVLIDDLDLISEKEEIKALLKKAVRDLLNENTSLLVFCTSTYLLNDEIGIDFLFSIHLKRPDAEARLQILRSLRKTNKNLANLNDQHLQQLATNTPSFTAPDLKKMLCIAETEADGLPSISHCDIAVDIVKQSFERGTHLIGDKPAVTWNDIGGMAEVRSEFAHVMRQLKKGDINCKFAGIALFGPPGCGKTMVAQAMANEAGLNFISIKPTELVNKFLGETEKNIRRVFSEAREFEPCMVYFDEFDGLCGTRGHRDNVTSAIQTLLSEMDGFARRGKSIILVSTNRLEDIDPAMKRPGRLSKHIFVGPPNTKARCDILKVITSRLSIALDSSLDLQEWASRTKHFTGAELDFLINEANSKALNDMSCQEEDLADETINCTLTNEHLEYAMKEIKKKNRELGKKIYSKIEVVSPL